MRLLSFYWSEVFIIIPLNAEYTPSFCLAGVPVFSELYELSYMVNNHINLPLTLESIFLTWLSYLRRRKIVKQKSRLIRMKEKKGKKNEIVICGKSNIFLSIVRFF